MIDGKYWMYWGETFVNLAHSKDGKQWEPIQNKAGELLHVFQPTLDELNVSLL